MDGWFRSISGVFVLVNQSMNINSEGKDIDIADKKKK